MGLLSKAVSSFISCLFLVIVYYEVGTSGDKILRVILLKLCN